MISGKPAASAPPTGGAWIFWKSREGWIVGLLAALAALHVFVFSAAFPFFNIVDEDAHFDLVVKYSHGRLPVGLETVSPEAARYLVRFGTREYLYAPAQVPGGRYPPPEWSQPTNDLSERLFGYKLKARLGTNHENSQPPLYYLLAGIWFDAGKVCGLHGGSLLLWLRLLNMILVAALVWLAHRTARSLFPENYFLRLGVPALLAFLPQTAFYSINNDILSPLCFGAAFLCLLRWLRADVPGVRLGAVAGLTLAATYLVKLSNLPLLAVAAAAVLLKAGRLARTGKFRASLPALASLVLCAGLPVSAWRIWVKLNFGDATGAAMKMRLLGWTYQPPGAWWHHPLFTPAGGWAFLSKLTATFWQGEFLWHGRPLAAPAVDLIYALLSAGLIGVAMFSLWRRPAVTSVAQRQALWLGFACVLAAAGFLAGLSLLYDFHDCFYPSRGWPYFTSGRLLLGALIPFMLLFVFGLDRALRAFGEPVKFRALAGLILFMLIAETVIDWPVFGSPYNWFHM